MRALRRFPLADREQRAGKAVRVIEGAQLCNISALRFAEKHAILVREVAAPTRAKVMRESMGKQPTDWKLAVTADQGQCPAPLWALMNCTCGAPRMPAWWCACRRSHHGS